MMITVMLRLPIEYNKIKGQPPKHRSIARNPVVDFVFVFGFGR